MQSWIHRMTLIKLMITPRKKKPS